MVKLPVQGSIGDPEGIKLEKEKSMVSVINAAREMVEVAEARITTVAAISTDLSFITSNPLVLSERTAVRHGET